MASRRRPSTPSLGLLGTAPVVGQLAVAARQLGWPLRPPDEADLLYVGAGSAADELDTLLESGGPPLAVDLGWIAEAGVGAYTRLVERAPGRVRRGEPLTAAPAVQEWLRRLRALDAVTHLSGRCTGGEPTSPAPVELTAPMVVVVLFAARMVTNNGTVSLRPEDRVRDDLRTVHVDRPGGDPIASIVVADRELPEFELQAASAAAVERAVLLPDPRLERSGVEETLPPSRPTVAFGHEPFLRSWWQAVSGGRPPTFDPSFLALFDEAMRSLEPDPRR